MINVHSSRGETTYGSAHRNIYVQVHQGVLAATIAALDDLCGKALYEGDGEVVCAGAYNGTEQNRTDSSQTGNDLTSAASMSDVPAETSNVVSDGQMCWTKSNTEFSNCRPSGAPS